MTYYLITYHFSHQSVSTERASTLEEARASSAYWIAKWREHGNIVNHVTIDECQRVVDRRVRAPRKAA